MSHEPMLQRREMTEQELEHAATITQADVDAAIIAFNSHAREDARGLLDAHVDDEEES